MTYDPWIGDDPTGPGCRVHWAPGWPACGEPVTLHVLSESAIDGLVCLATCERHAPSAREAGVYFGEHSPSHPGCKCRRTPGPAPDPTNGPEQMPYRPDVRLPLVVDRLKYGRPPYDPVVAARLMVGPHLAASDGLTHSLVTDDQGVPVPRCGAPFSPTRQLRLTRNWRVVSCPSCRTTETTP